LGVAEDCTDDMEFTTLDGKCKVLVHNSVWAIMEDELSQELIKEKLEKFDESVKLVYVRGLFCLIPT
jgi:hypothetical protein